MTMRTAGMVIAAIGISAMPVNAKLVTQEQVKRAQYEMSERINSAVEAYARQIGSDAGYVNYCNAELNRVEATVPANGLIPFDVNYFDITDSERLNLVIRLREDYERSFQILCLANAKAALKAAAQK